MAPGLSTTRDTVLAAILVVTLVAGLTACGGGGGGGGAFPAPTLTNVTPVRGPVGGDTTLTLTGTNFVAGATVTVGGNAATVVTVVNATTLTCVTPAGTAGATVAVAVTTAGGTATLAASFTYNPVPTLTSVDPSSIFASGGATLTLTGTGFTANAAGINTVLVGGVPATNVVAVNDTTLTCTAPAGNPGPVPVQVTNANGSALLQAALRYLAYPPTFLAADIRTDTDTAGGRDSTDPRICCDGSNLYVVWQDARHGGWDIFFNRSTDGGSTWLANDVRLDTDTPGVANSREPEICCDGSNVYVVWEDDRSGGVDIRFSRSVDGGATWLVADLRLDTDTAGAANSADPEICCDGSSLYVVWEDDRNGSSDIHLNRSADGGATWLAADVRLDTDTAGAAASSDPKICCDGSNVYVVWNDFRNPMPDVYVNRSTNGGATWLGTDVRVETDLAGTASSEAPQICCDGSTVYVAWHTDRDGKPDIRFSRSTDSGQTWLISDIRLNTDTAGAAESSDPQICCDGSNVYVAWEDDRDGSIDIRFSRSTNGGLTWLTSDVRLDTDTAGAATSEWPNICCDGSNVYVVWHDDRNGGTDVFFSSSTDGGATWLASDIRLDTDVAGNANSERPWVCCDDARAFVVWQDDRDGNRDVYFSTN